MYAINLRGEKIAGWNKGEQFTNYSDAVGSGLDHMLSVSDIDNDGKNEIVCIDGDSHVYIRNRRINSSQTHLINKRIDVSGIP